MGKQHATTDAAAVRAKQSAFYSRRDAANLLGVCINTLRVLGDPSSKYFDATCPRAQKITVGRVGYEKIAFDLWLKNRPAADERLRSKTTSEVT